MHANNRSLYIGTGRKPSYSFTHGVGYVVLRIAMLQGQHVL